MIGWAASALGGQTVVVWVRVYVYVALPRPGRECVCVCMFADTKVGPCCEQTTSQNVR